MAILRNVQAKWTPSLSPDVIGQKLRWYLNGRLIKTVHLNNDVRKRDWLRDCPRIKIREEDTVKCEVCALDEIQESPWINAEVLFENSVPDGPTAITMKKEFRNRPVL
jgi:hypothetical protein